MTRIVRKGAVFVGLVLLALALEPDQAMTDDMRYYVPAAASYAGWLSHAFTPSAWSRGAIDRAFAPNHEHPPVAKYAMGLTWLVFHGWFGLDDVTACRLAVIMLWAWTCMVLYGWVTRLAGPMAAIAATCCFVLMPRVLFDAHAETLDFAVTAFLVAAGASLFAALETPRWRTIAAAVVLYALALGTKLNAPFAIAGVCGYWLATWRPKRQGLDLQIEPVPVVLLLVLVVSPLIAVAVWPWMWFDTANRLDAYLQFHLHHYNILFFFDGTLFDDHPAPWYAPLTMLMITTPLVTLALALAGLASPKSPLKRFALWQIGAQLAAVCLPGTPKYGGVKLFLPVFPYLAVLAGLGFDAAARQLATLRARWALLAVCLAPSLVGVIAYRGYWLSYYNELAGGVRGATRAGFERQYYDLAYPSLRDALTAHAGPGAAVAVLPNPKEYGPYFERWGFRLVPPETAKVVVLTHERRWPEYPEHEARLRVLPRLATIGTGGVPLFTLYRGGLPGSAQ